MAEMPEQIIATLSVVITEEEYHEYCEMTGETATVEGFKEYARTSFFEYIQQSVTPGFDFDLTLE